MNTEKTPSAIARDSYASLLRLPARQRLREHGEEILKIHDGVVVSKDEPPVVVGVAALIRAASFSVQDVAIGATINHEFEGLRGHATGSL